MEAVHGGDGSGVMRKRTANGTLTCAQAAHCEARNTREAGLTEHILLRLATRSQYLWGATTGTLLGLEVQRAHVVKLPAFCLET